MTPEQTGTLQKLWTKEYRGGNYVKWLQMSRDFTERKRIDELVPFDHVHLILHSLEEVHLSQLDTKTLVSQYINECKCLTELQIKSLKLLDIHKTIFF